MKHIKYISNYEEWEKDFKFYNEVKVRFSETDLFGHLNNTVPFIYFEEARINYLEHLDLMADWLQSDGEAIIVVADLQCDYLSQVYFGEKIKVYVKADSVGNSSVDIHYLGKRENGNPCFVGRGTVVQVSKVTGKGLPWTDKMKDAFLK